jgi:uncharacterized protein (TIGR03435 family)
MKSIFSIPLAIIMNYSAISQSGHLKPGDYFPDYILRPIVNAPVKEYDITKQNRKYLVLNFWGTWCAPCIPEMDTLAKLQERNKDLVHIIAISNDATEKLKIYLKKRPSKLWLASDTSFYLYHQFGFNYVGQSAILDNRNRIIALVRTDSINQQFIDNLIHEVPLVSSAETGISSNESSVDYFGLDSNMTFSATLCSARPMAYGSGSPDYKGTPFEGRRISVFNVPETFLYNIAFNIKMQGQTLYLPDEKTVFSKARQVCFDLLVEPGQKDSLKRIMQEQLNKLLPFKAKLEKRKMPVYLLNRKEGDTTSWKESDESETFVMFTGNGFTGKAVPVSTFCEYLSNELLLPVIDETGLIAKYDIKTVNVLRDKNEIMRNIDLLGLHLEKTERVIDVLVISH